MKAAAGMSLPERLPKPASGRVTASLREVDGRHELVVWVGEPETIAIFPRVASPVAAAWRSRIILLVVEETGARTLDDLRGEVL
jgi:hypothetical protein